MNNANNASTDLKQLDRLCDEFESAWRRGDRPQIEQFLQRFSPARRPDLLRELLALELDYRDEDHTEPSRAEYETRFAEWPQVVRDVFREANGSTARGKSAGEGTRSFEQESPAATNADSAGLPRIPGYELLGVLGRGAMGVVYKARHARLGRIVALKMLLAGEHSDVQHLQRFRAEAEAIAAIQHPNIVQVFEFGEHLGLPYFALEHVTGGTLRERIGGTPQPPRDSARLMVQLAAAVQVAHDQSVIHRDIKPSNILLTQEGTPKLTDFGLARRMESDWDHTKTGDIVGTPSYMAPEQAAGRIREIGPATDVYALGAVLYELLTGHPPFRGETGWDTMAQVLSQDPVPPRRLQPKVPRDLETICLKCLSRAPRDRYGTAGGMAEDLTRWLEGRPITARPAGVVGRAARFARRKPAVAALVAVVVLSVTTAVAGLMVHNRKLSEALAEVSTQRDRAVRAESEATENVARAEQTHRKARAAVNECFAIVTEDELFAGPGMEPARMVLLEAAAKYFDELALLRATTPEERAELADAHFKVGVIRDEIGDQQLAIKSLDVAVEMFERLVAEGGDYSLPLAAALHQRATLLQQRRGAAADDIRAALSAAESAVAAHLKRHAGDPAGTYARSLIHFDRGRLEADHDQHQPALEQFQQALAELERLEQADPKIVRYHAAAATTNLAMGRVFRRLENLSDATKAFAAAHARLAPLLSKLPDAPQIQFSHAQALIELANLEPDQAASLAKFREARRNLRRLHDSSPRVHDYKEVLAVCATRIGDELSCINQTAEALRYYQEAELLYRELRTDNPDNIKWAIQQARTLHESALALTNLGEVDSAQSKYEQALSIRQSLVEAHPERLDLRQDLERNLNNLAVMRLEQGQAEQAKLLLMRLLSERLTLAEQRSDVPQFKRDVGGAYVNLGQAYRSLGDHDLAANAVAEGISVFRALHQKSPNDNEYLRLLIGSLANAADLHADELNDREAARALLAEGESLVAALEERLPDDRDAQGVAIIFWFNAGQIHSRGGQATEALLHFQNAVRVARAVLDKNPKDSAGQNFLALAQQNCALVHWKEKRIDETFAAWTASLAAHEAAAQLNPKATKFQEDLNVALRTLVSHARDRRRWDVALTTCKRLREQVLGQPDELLEVAEQFALCGGAATASADNHESDSSFAAQFVSESLATLWRAAAEGLADDQKLRSSKAFDPLRDQEEFQALLAQISARAAAAK